MVVNEKTLIYKNPEEGHEYIMTVDVSKGRGQDYSTFSIIDMTSRPFKQVATFRDNVISPLLFPDVLFNYSISFNVLYWVIIYLPFNI